MKRQNPKERVYKTVSVRMVGIGKETKCSAVCKCRKKQQEIDVFSISPFALKAGLPLRRRKKRKQL